MIESLNIHGVATYVDTPQTMSDLRANNFVFGANGAGKTTISRLVADPANQNHRGCAVHWKSGLALKTFVYNADFVSHNFNTDHIGGVFTVGEQAVDAAAKLSSLKASHAALFEEIKQLRRTLDGDTDGIGKRGELAAAHASLVDQCWIQKQAHDEAFAPAFKGVRGDRAKFCERVLQEVASNTAALHPIATLRERAATVFAATPETEPIVELPSPAPLESVGASLIFSKVVVGKADVDVAALISRLGISDWVKQGQRHLAHSDGVCPLCQQQVPDDLAARLEQYFDESFAADMREVGAAADAYRRAADAWSRAVDRITQLVPSRLDMAELHIRAEAVAGRLQANILLVDQKVREPSKVVQLESLEESATAFLDLLRARNVEVKAHNDIVQNIGRERQDLAQQVWRFLTGDVLSAPLQEYKGKAAGLDKAIASLTSQIQTKSNDLARIDTDIRLLEQSVVSVQPTVDRINGLLTSYGFRSFSLERVSSGNLYRLRRPDGAAARQTLSEGERTFISFLYFYFLLEGSTSDTGTLVDRIAVIDDPISSLDSDVLFIVSGLVQRLLERARIGTDRIKQVFVLTHNVHFHREASFNSTRRGALLKEESYWLVRKTSNASTIERCDKNPISSAYDLLWEELRRGAPYQPSIQNSMRRILETYFKLLGGIDPLELTGQLPHDDQVICRSLLSWVNAGSHNAFDDLHMAMNGADVDKQVSVFKRLFAAANQLPHYEMMMQT